jgi:tRNA-splicing ligase RtcB
MKIYGQHDDRTVGQLSRCVEAEPGALGVLCADGHVGYSMPIGGVVAYRGFVSPSGVGYDIACGNMAVQTNLHAADLPALEMARLADEIQRRVSFGVGRKNNEPVHSPVLDRIAASPIAPQRALVQMAEAQLGTVGSGNHYVDIFSDEHDRVWVGVHFGSRGLGHRTATWFLKAAGAQDGMDVPPCVLDANSDLGQQYLLAMDLAGKYAYAGRDWVCSKVARILNGTIVEEVHNHHNFAWRETHDGEDYWVVRKGATPAFPGQRGFVGGTMGETSVILEGIENKNARHSLYSTVHGAGRVMGRLEAKGKVDRKTGEVKRAGKVTQDMMDGWVKRAGVELRGAGLDESPDCYKRLGDVLNEHGDSIRIMHTLTPIGVAMAGANEHDPFKD